MIYSDKTNFNYEIRIVRFCSKCYFYSGFRNFIKNILMKSFASQLRMCTFFSLPIGCLNVSNIVKNYAYTGGFARKRFIARLKRLTVLR